LKSVGYGAFNSKNLNSNYNHVEKGTEIRILVRRR
jgi:hypothetical protein